MTEPDVKDEIRRRLFRSAVQAGDRTPKFGYALCTDCRGRGDVCIERQTGDRWQAAFESCVRCGGEGIVPTEAP